jgi:hypothetical protein
MDILVFISPLIEIKYTTFKLALLKIYINLSERYKNRCIHLMYANFSSVALICFIL